MAMLTDTRALIDGLAAEWGVSKFARDKWRLRGVPHRYRLALVEAARERGVELTLNDFAPTPTERHRRPAPPDAGAAA